ncbi:hypothetical protein Cni_G13857 [Canna indica]|uniref:Uncharacterized protein n=1 Tax=Canna indica TaxID=4628 RepID=A0AAQ3KBY4_9LILI|nr:hypothetical protein Cni_G13857 [Canna indica]
MACMRYTTTLFSARFKYRLSSSSSTSPSCARAMAASSSHSLRTPRIAPSEHLRYDSALERGRGSAGTKESKDTTSEHDDDEPSSKEDRQISGIHVPRHKYISVSKVDLLNAILSMFRSEQDVKEFKRLAMWLDSIIHAEHKGILEEMRTYYSSICIKEQQLYGGSSIKVEEDSSSRQHISLVFPFRTGNGGAKSCGDDEVDKLLSLSNKLDLRKFFGEAPMDLDLESRTAVANNLQRSFMKLLQDAQFEELSVEDLLLTDSLNNDYLLRLPIYVDWKRTFDSNAIIFRRGYATERQQGLLLVEKLDYLQSKLLQEIFFRLSKPMKQIGKWLNEALESSQEAQNIQIWIEKVKAWIKENYSPENPFSRESISRNQLKNNQVADSGDLPVWLAAQKAVSHYEGLLSPVGPRGRLIRRLLTWIGIISSPPEVPLGNKVYSETYLRPNFLPRITLSNLWEPASMESCGYNIWRMLKTATYILFSQSTLQEPAFQELVLLYIEKGSQNGNEDRAGINPLQLKIYEKIPIPELPVIFPHKKLSFRILDTVRLDIASILGLLAYFINYKFENIASSPSAVFLDVIAISALIIYVSRVVLGYKQTRDRYQLLVNRTLHEKTLASGFGSVHFLLDASEQQQFKEAILLYAILLHPESYQVSQLLFVQSTLSLLKKKDSYSSLTRKV